MNQVKQFSSEISLTETKELINSLERIQLKPAPRFIGNFEYRMHRNLSMYNLVANRFKKLMEYVPDQKFNTWFIQKYEPGQNVLPHKDPMNNKGYTVIGLFGLDFKTILSVQRADRSYQHYIQKPGDIFVLPTTINGIQGPRHSVEWANTPQATTRWALIANTLEYK